MGTILLKPSVYIVGQTNMSYTGVMEFFQDHHPEELEDENGDTPASIIANHWFDEDNKSDLDLMTEFMGRFCYRSFGVGRDHESYINNILEQAHGSVTEHSYINFALTGVSRSLSLELIRHRTANVSQESQRYVLANEINLILPPIFIEEDGSVDPEIISFYEDELKITVRQYEAMTSYLESKLAHVPKGERVKRVREAARSVLPNCAETRIGWTTNIRALRHILELRGSTPADLEIRRLAVAMLEKVRETYAGNAIYTDEKGERVILLEDFKVGKEGGHPFLTSAFRKV